MKEVYIVQVGGSNRLIEYMRMTEACWGQTVIAVNGIFAWAIKMKIDLFFVYL